MKPARALLGALAGLVATIVPLGAAGSGDPVAEAIAARLDLMRTIDADMVSAETLAADSEAVTAAMTDLAARLAGNFASFAELFPANTNLLGGQPAPEGIATTASTAIWDDFPAFAAEVRKAGEVAAGAAAASDLATYRQALASLREGCTSCHDNYVVFDPFAAF